MEEQQQLISFVDERRYSYLVDDHPHKEQFPLWYLCEKEEVILNAGEMLYIPAGWFHFVFSEGDGLNSAINFWYETQYNEGQESDEKPRIEKHSLDIDIKKIVGDDRMAFYKSKGKVFPPVQMFHRFPKGYMDSVGLTYDEFLESKNPRLYAVQSSVINSNHHAPQHHTKVKKVSLWLNFGKNARSLPHYDMDNNWLCQLSGTKRVILIEQKYRNFLYLRNSYSIPFVSSIQSLVVQSTTQPYVLVKPSLTEIECNIIKENDEITRSDMIFPHLNKILIHEGVNLIKRFQSMQLVVSPPEDVIRFKIEKVNALNRDVLDIDDSMYTALWALDKSLIVVGAKEYYLNQGDIIVFPTQLSYTWHAEPRSFIIYPIYKD